MSQRLAGAWRWTTTHPVLAVFLVALAARAVVALVVFVAHDGALFTDDAYFQRLARQMADGQSDGWPPYDRSIFFATSTFLWPLTFFAWLGSAVLPGQLMVALAGAGAAALTTAIGLRTLRVAWAIAAGAVMALLPSMVLWSSLTLKDAFVWCVLAALGLAVYELSGSPRRLAAAAAAIVVLLFALSHLRDQTFVIAAWTVPAAAVVAGGKQWLARAGIGIAVLLLLPAVLGYGVAAGSWIDDAVHGLVDRREGNTIGADSALACPDTSNDVGGVVEHLPCGLPAIALRPYPWESGGSLGLRLARLESVIWYPLLAAALFGVTKAWSHRRALAFPVIASIGTLLVYASVEGNLGTAFRHRGESVWGIALLAALGAQVAHARYRRSDAIDEPAMPTGTLVH